MNLIDKYLNEGYTKKSAVSNSDKISKELYEILKDNRNAAAFMGVSVNDIKPKMFKIVIERGQAGISHYSKPPKNIQGRKRGRRNTRMYDYIAIRWYDSFSRDFMSRLFSTAKEFNNYIEHIKRFKEEDLNVYGN